MLLDLIDSNFWGYPAIYVYGRGQHTYENVDGGKKLKLFIPGIKKEDILAKVDKNTYLCVEFKNGKEIVKRTFWLEEEIDIEKIKAEYKDGVLEIFLPEKESFTKVIPIA